MSQHAKPEQPFPANCQRSSRTDPFLASSPSCSPSHACSPSGRHTRDCLVELDSKALNTQHGRPCTQQHALSHMGRALGGAAARHAHPGLVEEHPDARDGLGRHRATALAQHLCALCRLESAEQVDGHASHVAGDGMAIWLTQERAKPGPVFGSINYFTGLGIFLDTYPNSRHPYSFPRISLMNGNGVEAYENDKDGRTPGSRRLLHRLPQRQGSQTKAKLIHVKGVYTELLIHHSEWDPLGKLLQTRRLSRCPSIPISASRRSRGDVSGQPRRRLGHHQQHRLPQQNAATTQAGKDENTSPKSSAKSQRRSPGPLAGTPRDTRPMSSTASPAEEVDSLAWWAPCSASCFGSSSGASLSRL
ncbi:hypothetical protein L1887_42353 [Cichorium endivia]|nr:hypothetical protein L1887_42353 [Cichorium endivia]